VSYGNEKARACLVSRLFKSDLRTFSTKRVTNIQNTPTVKLHRLAQQQEETTRFYTDLIEIGSPSSINLGSIGGDPYTTNSNFPMFKCLRQA